MDTLLADPDAFDSITLDSKEKTASVRSNKKDSDSIADPKRKINMQNRTGKAFVEDELDILAQIEQVEAREENPFGDIHDDGENDFARNFDKLVQGRNQNSRGPSGSNAEKDRQGTRSKRVGFDLVNSAEKSSDNAPLSGRGRGSSSEGDKDLNISKGNRTGTYQKRSEVKSSAPTPPARHRMTLRELQLVLP
jgi:hypothetical protein